MGVIHTPHLHEGNVEQKRQEIMTYFLHSFDTYESLFGVLNSPQAFYERPDKLRHPLIFYYGHTATFFVNKLMLAKQINARINPEFESLFATGVDEMSWDDLNQSNYQWPSVIAVQAYRKNVKQLVTHLIQEMQFTLPINWHSPMWSILMGIEHERIHLETSSVLIRQLDIRFVQQSTDWPRCKLTGKVPENTLLNVPMGLLAKSLYQLHGKNGNGKKDFSSIFQSLQSSYKA